MEEEVDGVWVVEYLKVGKVDDCKVDSKGVVEGDV